MNAPRSGLYASFLALSFVAHAILMVRTADQQIDHIRSSQGALLVRQLADEASLEIAQRDTVALGLLASRYNERPDIARLEFVDRDQQVLATGGSSPARDGTVFEQAVQRDGEEIGKIRLTVASPSKGELVRLSWLPLLLSALVHGILWLLYTIVARPPRQWYHDQLAMPVSSPAPAAIPVPPVPMMPPTKQAPWHDQLVCSWFWVAFDDPRQLMETVSSTLLREYFELCQKLADQVIAELPSTWQVHRLQRVDRTGLWLVVTRAPEATITPDDSDQIETEAEEAAASNQKTVDATGDNTVDQPHDLATSLQLANVMGQLFEQVYLRYRERGRFALHPRTVMITEMMRQQANQQDGERVGRNAEAEVSARRHLMALRRHAANLSPVIALTEDELEIACAHCTLKELPEPEDWLGRHSRVLAKLPKAQTKAGKALLTRLAGNRWIEPEGDAASGSEDQSEDQDETASEVTEADDVGHSTENVDQDKSTPDEDKETSETPSEKSTTRRQTNQSGNDAKTR